MKKDRASDCFLLHRDNVWNDASFSPILTTESVDQINKRSNNDILSYTIPIGGRMHR